MCFRYERDRCKEIMPSAERVRIETILSEMALGIIGWIKAADLEAEVVSNSSSFDYMAMRNVCTIKSQCKTIFKTSVAHLGSSTP